MLIDLQESNIEIEESKDSQFLGKLKGVFFVPGGISRNKRYYPRDLWEKVVSDSKIQERIQNRQMFGTISHTQPLDDTALLEGKMSHVITNIHINEKGEGIGEACILDTQAGRTLNTIMRAGCKVYVSSRAHGSFKGEQNGVPVVDKNSYQLKTWDIVLDPGFLQANPALAEDLQQTLEDDIQETDKESIKMDPKFTENLMSENNSLKANIQDMTKEVKDAEAKVAVLESKVEDAEATKVALAEANAKIAQYEELGSVEDINTSSTEASEKIASLEGELKESAEKVEKFEELGSVEDINKVFEMAEKNNAKVKEYETLGSVEEFNQVIEALQSSYEKKEEIKRQAAIEDLAKELNVSKEVVEAVYGKMEEEEIKTFIKGISNSSEWVPSDEDNSTSKNESSKEDSDRKPRATRLMESMYRFED